MQWRYVAVDSTLLSNEGEEVTLEEVLASRDARMVMQQNFLKQGKVLVSLTLTAFGSVKRSPLLDEVFDQAFTCLKKKLSQEAWLVSYQVHVDKCGHLALFSVDVEQATELKHAMIVLESQSLLTRLWDIDVFDKTGRLLSRTELGFSARECLVCERSAKICAKSQQHKLSILRANLEKRVRLSECAHSIAKQMQIALCDEATLTPKAGLVDAMTQGGHSDMDLSLFILSAEVIRPFLVQCVEAGMLFSGQKSSPSLLSSIRFIGVSAEKAMLKATKGVNTHKGAIFAFGLLGAALGKAIAENDKAEACLSTVFKSVQQMSAELPNELEQGEISINDTAGQRIFKQYGLLGARGEAASGFYTIVNVALPSYTREWKKDGDVQRALLVMLLNLYAHNDDTTTVQRVGLEGLRQHQYWAKSMLSDQSIIQHKDRLIQVLKEYDIECSQKRLSAGGSADLLAISIFILKFFKNSDCGMPLNFR